MIVDTSAIVAILKGEPEAERFAALLEATSNLAISAATYFETATVMDRLRQPVTSRALDELLEHAQITLEPVTEEQVRIAREAYRDYGKGSGHRANLNFGDCFSYALARVKREPLLFKGDGFLHTDVRPAVR